MGKYIIDFNKPTRSFSYGHKVANEYKLPAEYRFSCRWFYTVDSYAGDRLYKYDETREVEQVASYVRIEKVTPETFAQFHHQPVKVLTAEEALFEISVVDEEGVTIKRRNVGKNRDKYDAIVDEARKFFLENYKPDEEKAIYE